MKVLTSAQVAQIKQALDDPTADRCFAAIGMLDKAPSFKADKWIDALIEKAMECERKES
jgi:hypothetical protein